MNRTTAWEAFADRVKQLGSDYLEATRSGDAVSDAEGLRYLIRLLGRSITDEMMAAEAQPMLRLNTTDISKAGFDAAECKYTYCAVDSAGTYRVWGTLGTAEYISFQLYGYPTVDAAGDRRATMSSGPAVNHLGLKPGADGSFELMISARRPEGWSGPWLELSAPNNVLFGREYFNDWEHAAMSRFHIARTDAWSPAPLDDARAERIAESVAHDFAVQLGLWKQMAAGILGKGVNALQPTVSGAATMGQDELAYGFGAFDLEAHEALIVEIDVPDASFWTIELGNLACESVDYVNRPSSLTTHHAAQSADGAYRIVIAGADPGVANWLDTAGHGKGLILYRYFLARTKPVPKVTKAALADLASMLPPDTKRASAEERRADLAMRRRHAAIRWTP